MSGVDTAIRDLLEKIYAAWNQDKKYYVLIFMMGVSAAYSNILLGILAFFWVSLSKFIGRSIVPRGIISCKI